MPPWRIPSDAASSAAQSSAALGEHGRRIIDLFGACSIESSPRDHAVDEVSRAPLAAGTSVYLPHIPGDRYTAILSAARRLRGAGFEPVPHIAARRLESVRDLDAYLARAVGEAGVEQVLVVGGDVDNPIGPFRSSLEILETGLFAKHGIRRIGIAGYPEGHPRIAPPLLDDALQGKLALLRQQGTAAHVVTQFCFEAAPILSWVGRLRERGVDAPIHIGLAAPTRLPTLLKFAMRCGIGNSIRALRRQASVARMLAETGPEAIVAALAAASSLGDIALHFFTFGGIARSSAWIDAAAQGRFELSPDGGDLHIRL
jgi:methylenetetrahydrofolate reductase (NADPH)